MRCKNGAAEGVWGVDEMSRPILPVGFIVVKVILLLLILGVQVAFIRSLFVERALRKDCGYGYDPKKFNSPECQAHYK